MKPLQLTQQQKDNLLEMCTKLFPEYSKEFSRNEFAQLTKNDLKFGGYETQVPEWSVGNDGVIYLQFYYTLYEDMTYEVIEIHWFEFCHTYLIDRLNEAGDFYNDINYGAGLDFSSSYEHPVDYLYKHFKKIYPEITN